MDKRKYLFIFLFIFFISAHCKDIIHTYSVSISRDLSTLYVKAQFGKTDFYYLYAGSESASKYTQNMYLLSDKSKIYTPKTDELMLDKNAAEQTLYYEFDIKSSLGKGRWSSARKIADDVIIPPDLWLWRPYALKENEHIEVRFDFPADLMYSTPWLPISKNLFRIPHTPLDWPSATVFGTFTVDTVRVENSKFAIVFMDGSYKTTHTELIKWFKGSVRAVCDVYGEFPVNNAQVLIIPGKPGNEPVPFGMVIRGGGLTIFFYVDPSRPLDEFIEDWTATHELSHCLLPLISRDDAWLSEGLATYYQYILMGRDKRLTEQQTWQRIYNGFQKGIRGSKGETLKTTAQNMREFRAFRNVYWSGAAMLLKADVALRKESNGKESLDTVLKKIQQNTLPKSRSWTGLEMMQTMDTLANTNVFMDTYNLHIHSKIFPVGDEYWAQLGIIIKEDVVYLDDKAPLAHIRKNLLKNGK